MEQPTDPKTKEPKPKSKRGKKKKPVPIFTIQHGNFILAFD